MKRLLVLCIVCILAALALGVAQADIILNSDNSTLKIRNVGGGDPQQVGMFDWQVDGVNQLYQQWWWYRLGSGANSREFGIETLNLASQTQSADYLEQVYTYGTAGQAQAFELTVDWSLSGGSTGTGSSDVGEQAKVRNIGTQPLDMHLFEYSDFDLNGTFAGDSGVYDGVFMTQTKADTSVTELAIPKAAHWQLASFPIIRNSLNDNAPTTLSDSTSPLNNTDVTWAFQWDKQIGAGRDLLISKDKLLQRAVPEWNSLLLAAMGMVGTIGIRRRRK